TGFSGLSHLRRVPVDGVKIDRSFVADVLRDPDDLALTSAIIAMAHSLGITVVAEGIEAEGQFAVLRERGCDQGQGFWLGRPMAAEDIAAAFAGERRAALSRTGRPPSRPAAPRTPPPGRSRRCPGPRPPASAGRRARPGRWRRPAGSVRRDSWCRAPEAPAGCPAPAAAGR